MKRTTKFFNGILSATAPKGGSLKRLFNYQLLNSQEAYSSFLIKMKPLLVKHYPNPDVYKRQLNELGDFKAGDLVNELLPTKHNVRAGELGEILMSEFTEVVLGVTVPVKRLRFKDGRNNPIRGVDSLGVSLAEDKLSFVKGEAKVRRYLTTEAMQDARESLDSSGGSVSRYTALMVVNHAGAQHLDLVRACEALAGGLRKATTHHLVFTAYERTAVNALQKFLDTSKAERQTIAVGLQLSEYHRIIKEVFEAGVTPSVD